VERNISENGFTARWQVSQITLASITSDRFGVRLVKPVTQYRQTERSIKYGLLVIFLIFIAAFAVEMISKKPISLIQYMVVGASLVLFYALLLAFSDFLSFGLSYLIAAVMTSGALGAYFGAIVKSKWAYLLTGLVAAAYAVIYILLQMETFAFLTGTLLLFAILCVVMRLTRGTIETN
jgi:inner membrane protein